MLGERSIGDSPERHEQPPHPFRVHDKRPHVIFRFGVGLEIWNIIANPFLGRFVPPHLPARGVPGLALEVAGGSVVHHAAIGRPGERPVLVDAQPGRVAVITARGHVACFGERPAINPVAAGCRSVVFQPGKTGKLLAGFELRFRGWVLRVGKRLPVDFLQDFRERRIGRIGVAPGQL